MADLPAAALFAGPDLTLTATRRLARELRRRAARVRRDGGAEAWVPATVTTLDDFLAEVFREAWLPIVPLSPWQEDRLWETCLVAEGGDPSAETVALARGAERLLFEWQIDPGREPPGGAEAAGPGGARSAPALFLAARARRRACLVAQGWADASTLGELALDALARDPVGSRAVPRVLALRGFDTVPPVIAGRLCGLLAARGGIVEPLARSRAAPSPRAPPRWVTPADPDEELELVARWCRAVLEVRPAARIGIVLPQLRERWQRLAHVLEDQLTPGAILHLPEHATARHHLSVGPPLGEQPVVLAALRLVTMTPRAVDLDTVLWLLRTPFVAAAEREAPARARLEAELRRTRRIAWDLDALAARAAQGGAPELGAALGAFLAQLARDFDGPAENAGPGRSADLLGTGRSGDRCTSAEWVRRARARLAACGWPGERGLDSAEHQTAQRFQELLDEMVGLDLCSEGEDPAVLAQRLTERARRVSFQPQADEAPVQAMGVLEAGGLEFDHLWIAGLTDEAWPPRGAPHPFLPRAWQERHGLPHATPARSLAHARTVLARLVLSAPDVIASAPREVDGRLLSASRLLPEHHSVRVEAHPSGPGMEAADALLWPAVLPSRALVDVLAASAPLLEVIPRKLPPAIPAGSAVRGGVTVFADQAACPFRALARHRLGARLLEEPDERIDPRDRGELLHHALELFWQECVEHARLLALAPAERMALVERCVEAAGQRFLAGRDDLPAYFRRLELQRAREVLADWVQREAERAPFRVLEREVAREVVCGGLRVSARIDRIDALSDGRQVVIDYKTGQVPSPAAWEGPRPDQPQLPLYAMGLEQALLGAIAFGRLTRDKAPFVALCASDGLLPGTRAFGGESESSDVARGATARDWPALIEAWRTRLGALGEAFRASQAEVDPKHVRVSCDRCDLHALCRIADRDETIIADEEVLPAPEPGDIPEREQA